MKVLDLTHTIRAEMPVYPGTEPPELTTANTYAADGFQETLLRMYSHTGTHIDPPAHLFAGARTLDRYPAAQFLGRALVIDCRMLREGEAITMAQLQPYGEKLRDADVILLASPDYFGTVSARMKNFMDRTRPFHMVENVLAGKVGGALATAGLNNCGGEGTLALLDSWFATQGMLAVHPRTPGAPLAGGVVATGFAGLNEKGQPQWRSVKGDEIGFALARQLGREAVSLAARLR